MAEQKRVVKIAYNACYGGFNLSREAVLRARELSGNPKWGHIHITGDVWSEDNFSDEPLVPRHDPVLVQVIEELGERANGQHASLKIKKLSKGTRYRIDEYDGIESVETPESYKWVST